MRNLWVRIGVGAAVVFLIGMFVISLGRQVKAQVATAVESGGGRINVPFAMLPFRVGNERVGSIRTVDVRRVYDGGPRRLTIDVKTHNADVSELSNCLFRVDAPERARMFGCVAEGSVEASDLVQIGEVRLEPAGLVRPIVIAQDHAGDWFDDVDTGQLRLHAGEGGLVLNASDASGRKVVRLMTDSNGAYLDVRDGAEHKVVRLRASAKGLQIDVKGQ